MFFNLRKKPTTDQDLVSAIENAERSLANIQFLNGVSVTYTATTTGNKTISHGLGRVPQGFIPIKYNLPYMPYLTVPAPTDKTINLYWVTTGTVTFWIF